MKHVLRMREAIPDFGGFPDVCTINAPNNAATPVIAPNGAIQSWAHALRQFQASTNIPCRITPSRAFRAEKLMNQEANANEYLIHFPVGVLVAQNDVITITQDGRARIFEARKMTSVGQWQVTTEVLVTEMETQADAP